MTIDYPQPAGATNRVEPSPRRVRGVLGGVTVVDTMQARYVWEFPYYPIYYVPLADCDEAVLVDEQATTDTDQGTARVHGLRVGDLERPGSVRVFDDTAVDGVAGYVRIEFDALDAWYEEDEPIFIHPRSPYVRCDAVRSRRHVRISLDGVTLAESAAAVFLFETGLPTRYYFDRTDVAFEHLVPSDTSTGCPYKGQTSDYWTVSVDGQQHRDLAWGYDAPLRDVLPIANLVCFYNEKVDIELDGVPVPRPQTKFS